MRISLYVFDANTFISAALIQHSVNAQALDRAIETGIIAMSPSVLSEIKEVIYRTKFNKYLSDLQRTGFINRIERDVKTFEIKETIKACRDPKDDKYLDLAVTCNASCIITGDKDLLILNPFNDIPIITPAEFIKAF